jgi:hypothetical protein
MKIELVFSDWLNSKNESVYCKNGELSYGSFHSGSTFKADIHLNDNQKLELLEAMQKGFIPVFSVDLDTNQNS